jgi:hypothetical protein
MARTGTGRGLARLGAGIVFLGLFVIALSRPSRLRTR